MGMYQSLSQASHLDGENLLTSLVQHRALRNKWMGIVCTCQFHGFVTRTFNYHTKRLLADVLTHTGSKGGINATLATEEVNIYLTNHKLWLHFKALATSQQPSILIYQCIAGIDHIGSGFAKSAGTIDIA